LTRKLAAAPESQKDNLQDQIDVAKAQADLDQDEFDDASELLEQAGGDPQSKLKRLKAEHDASDHNTAQPGSSANPYEQDYQGHIMLPVFRAWKALREKQAKLEDARQETTTKVERLSQRHDSLAAQVEHEKENREAARQQAKSFSRTTKSASREESTSGAEAALTSLKQYSRDQKNLADLGRRIQDEKDLSDIYASWIGLVEIRERAAQHHLLEGLLWILVVAVFVYLSHLLIDRLFGNITAENKRIATLRSVVKFAAQVLGAIVIVFIVFGMPSQTTTILGLAGAGLTVAGKDVIMAFFGWFLLMGRNGIRVGDWVEIEGVGGEVIEIGLLKTVLLETGNWTDSGHPTGRRVSFVNSFAIEGHYFNFSTSGQWMWDELQLTIPADKDPYAVVDGLQKLVAKDTEANAREAEEEWQHTTTRYHVQAFSATPAISLRPTGSGVEVRVRYITRAYERHETRKRLYEAVVELMQGKREEVKSQS
jgi:small-conductance mechanosensitive channel